ncbi:MAG: DUF58 domain-containing protein [Flavobacteriales bacterium]|jgi:uncharacterized protein (DUF58 family)|nr:DUF58 domain-containing protein [Flavobacteriales bacterium]
MPIEQRHVQPLSALEFKARQVVEGFLAGLHKSPFHGFSVEFAEHRAYNSGESTRHMDWKLFARTDKLFVKRYEEETNLRCELVVDASSSMYYPEAETTELTKVGFAAHAAAVLIQLLRKQRDAVGLTVFSDRVQVAEQARSNAVHLRHLYAHLEGLLATQAPSRGQGTRLVSALHDIAQRAHRRSLVVILSDLLNDADQEEAVFDALQHLRFNKHDIVLFHVVDRQHELELALPDRPYTFVDVETAQEVKAHPSELRAAYKAAMEERWHRLKLRCAQYRIDLVEADVRAGFGPIMLEFLTRRARMY